MGMLVIKRPEENMIFLVRFEVFTAVTMKKAVFWDVAPCRRLLSS
jgi:hypothetical protein